MQARIDKFGRIIIPKTLREHIGLKPGKLVQLDEQDDKIVIRATIEQETLALRDGVLVFTGSATGDLIKAIKNDRRQRIVHLAETDE